MGATYSRFSYNPFLEAVSVLTEWEKPKETETEGMLKDRVYAIVEDVNSPVTRNLQEKMFQLVLNKAHIDFGDIPKSAGNIKKYSGYPTMFDTLQTIEDLAKEYNAGLVLEYVNIVKTAIRNLEDLSATYQMGFTNKVDYVALEYDTYVYFCVEATTSLIYSFVDIIKSPEKSLMDFSVRNTKLRADEFYFVQLKKFNKAQDNMGIEYRKMLENLCNKGKNNFTGVEVLGVTAVVAAAMAIVPITREIAYQIYHFRGKLSDTLATQATFLELNKTRLENTETMDAKKRQEIIKKQTELAKKLTKLSDIIRVKSAKSILDSKRELSNDNKKLSIGSITNDISNSPLEIL